MYRLGVGIALASLSCSAALAHHSYCEYADKRLVEIQGMLVRSALQNASRKAAALGGAAGS